MSVGTWVRSICEVCKVPGVWVFVPGNAMLTWLPALCSDCISDPEVKKAHERNRGRQQPPAD